MDKDEAAWQTAQCRFRPPRPDRKGRADARAGSGQRPTYGPSPQPGLLRASARACLEDKLRAAASSTLQPPSSSLPRCPSSPFLAPPPQGYLGKLKTAQGPRDRPRAAQGATNRAKKAPKRPKRRPKKGREAQQAPKRGNPN